MANEKPEGKPSEFKRVVAAQLQASVMLPKGNGTETSLYANKLRSLLWIAREGLLVECNDGAKALVPATNVKVVHFE